MKRTTLGNLQLVVAVLMLIGTFTGRGQTNCAEPGLIAHWPMIGGRFQDLSTNTVGGIVFGAVLRPDRFGNEYVARHFDGIDDYIGLTNSVKPPLPVTVAAWVKLQSYRQTPSIIFRNEGFQYNGTYRGLWLGEVDGRCYAGFGSGIQGYRPFNEAHMLAQLSTNEWHHLVAVFTNAENHSTPPPILLYVDGNQVPAFYLRDRLSAAIEMAYTSGNYAAIGCSLDGTDPRENFHGSIGEVRVYNSALNDAEVQALFLAANPNSRDSDGDGISDYAELVTGTSPCNAGEKAQFLNIRPAVELEFAATAGTTNRLQASRNLIDWWDVEAPIVSTGQLIRSFYRVEDEHRFFRLVPQ